MGRPTYQVFGTWLAESAETQRRVDFQLQERERFSTSLSGSPHKTNKQTNRGSSTTSIRSPSGFPSDTMSFFHRASVSSDASFRNSIGVSQLSSVRMLFPQVPGGARTFSGGGRRRRGHAAAVVELHFARQRNEFTRGKPVHVQVPLQLSTGDFENLRAAVAGPGPGLRISVFPFSRIHVERARDRHCQASNVSVAEETREGLPSLKKTLIWHLWKGRNFLFRRPAQTRSRRLRCLWIADRLAQISIRKNGVLREAHAQSVQPTCGQVISCDRGFAGLAGDETAQVAPIIIKAEILNCFELFQSV